jgi:6,7-dimethyl-8-ribityllumazine synthase
VSLAVVSPADGGNFLGAEMKKSIEGDLSLSNGRFAVVAAKFNTYVVDGLLEGALRGFRSCNVADHRIDVYRVPGSFELPLTAQRLAATGRYVAVVCLGAVIRGDTDHYDHVCQGTTQGLIQAGLTTGVPILFGVLTCDTEAQALDRAGPTETNKGYEAARAAVEMASLVNKIDGRSR